MGTTRNQYLGANKVFRCHLDCQTLVPMFHIISICRKQWQPENIAIIISLGHFTRYWHFIGNIIRLHWKRYLVGNCHLLETTK